MPASSSTSNPTNLLTQQPQTLEDIVFPILQKKHIYPDKAFHLNLKKKLSLDSPIEEHASWFFKAIYQHPFINPDPENKTEEIARYIHGITHVSRTAIYILVLANLYRRYQLSEIEQLNPEDIKLLQIAALAHDSAREDEGIDRWDHESSLILYYYLRRILNVPVAKAKIIAEAVANKDISDKGYFYISELNNGLINCGFNSTINILNFNKTIYQQLIHDADCLDIIRARPHFDANYLDFYRLLGSLGEVENSLAFNEMAQLICEIRSLISLQGDNYFESLSDIKTLYENEHCFPSILRDIQSSNFPILNELSYLFLSKSILQNKQLVVQQAYVSEKGITLENLMASLQEGLILARGIEAPTGVPPLSNCLWLKSTVEIELDKLFRTRGISTSSSKLNRDQKEGNPIRSVSLLGYGAGVYSDTGFLIINPDPKSISCVSTRDIDSGYTKKADRPEINKNNRPSVIEIEEKLLMLRLKLKSGGDSKEIKGNDDLKQGLISTHNELLYDVSAYNAIYYCNDQSPTSYMSRQEKRDTAAPFLQAVYLRQQYELHYQQAKIDYLLCFGEKEGLCKFLRRFGAQASLPIIEYSGVHSQIRLTDEAELTEDYLLEKWKNLVINYLCKLLNDPFKSIGAIKNKTINEIKIAAIYGRDRIFNELIYHSYVCADRHYSEVLQARIDQVIHAERERLITQYEDNIVKEIRTASSVTSFAVLVSQLIVVAVNFYLSTSTPVFFLVMVASYYTGRKIDNKLTTLMPLGYEKIQQRLTKGLIPERSSYQRMERLLINNSRPAKAPESADTASNRTIRQSGCSSDTLSTSSVLEEIASEELGQRAKPSIL